MSTDFYAYKLNSKNFFYDYTCDSFIEWKEDEIGKDGLPKRYIQPSLFSMKGANNEI